MNKKFTAVFCGSYSRRIPKFLKIMKITIVLWFVAIMHVSAISFAQKISLNVKNAPLGNVLDQLSRQSGYNFIYDAKVIQSARPVSISVNNEAIEEVLQKCFRDQPFTYLVNGNTIVIKRVDVITVAQQPVEIIVSGTVTDEKGKPMTGVNVRVKGTNENVVTGEDGEYKMKVADGNGILVFSFVGYITQEVPINNHTTVNISLKIQSSSLNEVIVVGYGSQKKIDVTGSIASVSAKDIESTPASNLVEALKGQAPGVDIQKSNGNSNPGSTPSIVIRGTRSLGTGNGPLYIVDGIPYTDTYILDLNQDDVASVQILKDASSTAIYGARGANGVILITTKHGKIGAPTISFSTYAGPSSVLQKYDVFNGPEFGELRKWAKYNGNPGKYTGIDDPKFLTDNSFDPISLANLKAGKTIDWQDLIFRSGFKTNNNLSVSGGTEKTKYAFSGGYYNEKGIFAGQDYQRYSFKISLDQQFGKYVKVGVSSLNSVSNINGGNINPMQQTLRESPLAGPYDAAGNLVAFPGGGSQVYNPLANTVPGALVDNRQRFNTFITLYGEVQILPGLKYRFNGGIQYTPETYGNFYGKNTYQNLGGTSTASNSSYNFRDYTLENILTYDKSFGKSHITFTGLFSTEDDFKSSTTFSYNSILADYIQYYNPTYGSNLSGSGSYNKFDYISYMGRLNYTYDDKYLLTLTMRSDGSSRLAPGNKYHVFPVASAGWNIAREDFLKDNNVFTDLKLRAGYGEVGNAAVNPYQTLGGLGSNSYNYGGTTVTGTYPNNIPNPLLTWEYTATLNLGLDFTLWKGRVSGSIDVYHEYTKNLLLPQSLPQSLGYTNSFFANVGKTENKGLEIGINANIIQPKEAGAFSWTLGGNITFNRNKITQLTSGVTRDIANSRFVGYSISSIYNYKRLGIWQNTAADSAAARKLGLTLTGAGSVIGTVKVADLNGDGKINSDDREIIGNRDPLFSGGFTNRFAYKNFDFMIVCSYRVGGLLETQIYEGIQFANSLAGGDGNLKINYWTPTNHQNYWPKPNSAASNPAFGDVLDYVSASYLKIRSLNLGYTLPGNIAKRVAAKSVRIYSSLNDAFILFSPYRGSLFHGIDPESAGTLGLFTPPTKSFLVGLNVTF